MHRPFCTLFFRVERKLCRWGSVSNNSCLDYITSPVPIWWYKW
nr:MAG TPA: hypothetical protein [Caudoviricetes sp.]